MHKLACLLRIPRSLPLSRFCPYSLSPSPFPVLGRHGRRFFRGKLERRQLARIEVETKVRLESLTTRSAPRCCSSLNRVSSWKCPRPDSRRRR